MSNNGMQFVPEVSAETKKELEEASAAFLRATCKAFPRLASEILAGCLVSVTTQSGKAIRFMAGGASPAGIIPAGGNIPPWPGVRK